MNSYSSQIITKADEVALWEQEYQSNFLPIYNYFYYHFKDHASAQDCTSETFETAWKSRKRYNAEKGAYSTWLFAIARQRRADYFRKKRFQQVEIPINLADTANSPAEMSEQAFIQAKVYELVSSLPEREREILSLRYGSGLSSKEIAEIMLLSDANVRKIIERSLQKIRTQWELDE